MPYFWKRHFLTVLSDFETISPGVYTLRPSGGRDFVSVVFIAGMLLLEERL